MKINKEQILKALNGCKPGLEKNGKFIFDGQSVYAMNDFIATNFEIETQIEGEILADKFFAFIEKINSDTITIKQSDDSVSLKAGKTKASFKIMGTATKPPVNFPAPNSKKWQLLPDDFCNSIKFCSFSASQDDSVFGYLYIKEKNVFSTDRFRATKVEMIDPIESELFIKASFVSDLVKHSPMKYLDEGDWIHLLNADKNIMSIRSTDISYPDIENTFEKIKGKSINLPSEIISTIERIGIISVDEFEQDRFIIVEIKDEKIICRSDSYLGNAEESIKTDYDGKEIKFKVHPDFFKQAIQHSNKMKINKKENIETVVFEGKNFQHVIALI